MTRYPELDLASFLALCPTRSAGRTLTRMNGPSFRKAEAEGLSVEMADRLACSIGRHPSEVWPQTWVALNDAEVDKVCDHCSTRFVPWHPHQRFCEQRCQRRWWAREQKRERYQNDPSYAERKREYRRRYYAENGASERARQRRYDRAKRAA